MKKILIIHTAGGVGDVLLSTCVIDALAQAHPEAQIDFLCLARNAAILEGHPGLRKVMTIEHKAPKGLDWWAWVQRLRAEKYEAALVLWSATGLAWMLVAAGIPIRVGQDSRLLYSFTYTHKVRIRSEHGDSHSHWTEILLDFVRALGIQPGPARVHFSPTAAVREQAKDMIQPLKGPIFGFHSTKGLSLATSRWPTAAFAQWAKALHDELGATLIFTGTPNDQEIVEAIIGQAQLERYLNLCGKTDLPLLAALAAECDAFLCPDSGPMHVAAAAGARVVGIYALAEDFPQRWAPHCSHRRILRPQPVGCRPGCIKANCPDFRCYFEVRSAEVVEAVRSVCAET
jgi:ADP-heptose:LPS heptosyltransferase